MTKSSRRRRDRPDMWKENKHGKIVGVNDDCTPEESKARKPQLLSSVSLPLFQNAANPWDLRTILLPAPTCRCWEAKHVSIGPDAFNEANLHRIETTNKHYS